jgi:DnaK suppressor protein
MTASQRLTDELQSTQRALAALQADYRALVEASADTNADDEHDPEGATIGFERAQLAGAIERLKTRRLELISALDRVAAGSYGRCQSCGSPIGDERLAARPSTTRCVHCA